MAKSLQETSGSAGAAWNLFHLKPNLKCRLKIVSQTLIYTNFRDKEIHHYSLPLITRLSPAVILEFPVNFLLYYLLFITCYYLFSLFLFWFICLETLCPHCLKSLRFSKWCSWPDPDPNYLPRLIQWWQRASTGTSQIQWLPPHLPPWKYLGKKKKKKRIPVGSFLRKASPWGRNFWFNY